MTPEIIKQHGITPDEYQKIIGFMGREPNLLELGIFSVLWSEHCSYKSSKIYLKELPIKGPQVLQGPGENAGVVDIGDGQAIVFKIESHNHPSFIEPYNGAATGVGGILRDVFTMGARPIVIMNSLRFGEVNHPKTKVLVNGVVSGIAGYGNCIGIPTIGGETYFDESYNGNILVNAMTVGLVDRNKYFKGIAGGVGNPIIYVGSKTGRDGIHGATMASDSFDEGSEEKRPTVQVGDPFTGKLLLEACLELMKTDVIVGIQDMGAAGLTSSSIEMASRGKNGIELNLDQVPTREEAMTPYEIMLSESQERMLVVVHKGQEGVVKKIFDKWDLDCSIIGTVTNDQRVRLKFHGEEVASIPVAALVDEAPLYNRPVKKPAYVEEVKKFDTSKLPTVNLQDAFIKIITHPNNASKKWVYRQYDHQVMDQTAILPGSDAGVVALRNSNNKGLSITVDGNARYVYLDPHLGGQIAVAEAGRNIVCTGAKPLAVTDGLNYGNPENPEVMWQFVESLKGIGEACQFFETPIIGGNVSFYNETQGTSIFPTPLIGMVGVLSNVDQRINSFFKNDGDTIILLGATKNELGGSEYLKCVHGKTTGQIPALDMATEKTLWKLMWQLNESHCLNSAHDLSDGGLALALAESCLGPKNIGAQVKLTHDLRDDVLLFSESQSRILISVSSDKKDKTLELAKQLSVPCEIIGKVGGEKLNISSQSGSIIDIPVKELNVLWNQGFEQAIFAG